MIQLESRSWKAIVHQAITQAAHIPRAIRMVLAAGPRLGVAWFVLLGLQALFPVCTVLLTRRLVNAVVQGIGNAGSWASMKQAAVAAALMAAVLLASEIVQSVAEWVRTAQSEAVQDRISELVHEKAMTIDFGMYESAEYYDRLYRVRADSASPLDLVVNCGNLIQNALTLLAMGAILARYGAWVPTLLLLSTIPAFASVVMFHWRSHEWMRRSTVRRRWAQYYDMMLTNSIVAAEVRLFALGPHFQQRYRELREKLRTEKLDLSRAQSWSRLKAAAGALAINGGAVLWMVRRATLGLATLGDIAMFYQAFDRGQTMMRSLLASVGQIYASSLYVGNLFEFLAVQPTVPEPAAPAPPPELVRRISFRNVSFRYPGSERIALEDFELEIPRGQITAIVGPNGAGKSTLIKLLCRFYDPESGRIEIDGTDIRTFRTTDLRRLFTVLFQAPGTYQATAGENIAMADLSRNPGMESVVAAADAAGAHEIIARLPDGYDTQLGKWFPDGTELSAGEWQRIAMARSFVRQSPVILLDEPTSFMDSWAETEWFDRFRESARGRTVVLITHRFTVAMRADRIHVMNQSRVVESGTHTELLREGGLYAQSWNAQMHASAAVVA